MNFLADQDVYQETIEFIKRLGFKVVRVKDVDLSTASDEQLLSFAKKNKYILITRDKDFGVLVFLKLKKHHGVIFLRIHPHLVKIVHKELALIFTKYSAENFENSFVVVEPGRHRIRKTVSTES